MDGPRKSRHQRLFALMWIWVSFRTLLPWLVFFRHSLEGDNYRWGTRYFNWTFYSSAFERADFLLICSGQFCIRFLSRIRLLK